MSERIGRGNSGIYRQSYSLITTGPVKDLNFPKEAIIGGIIRGNESFIAKGNTNIKPYDRVVVFALPTALAKVNKFFI